MTSPLASAHTGVRTLALAAALLAGAAATAPAAAQTATVSTSVGNNLVAAGRVAGDPTTFQTLAQTFVAPTAACPATTCYLQNFSFYLGDGFAAAGVRFRAYVYSFGAEGALTGPALYRSPEFAGSGNVFGLDPFRFEAANVALTRGSQYAFVLSATEGFALTADGSSAVVGATLVDEYAGGALYGATNGGDFAALGNPGALTRVAGAPDLSFQATFTAAPVAVVPEPATVVLLGGGLLAVGAGARARRRRRVDAVR